MGRTGFIALAVALASATPVGARAQGRSAQVSFLDGGASRQRGTAPAQALAVGAAVSQGDLVLTRESSRLELKLADGSVLRLGPSAKLQLTEAHFGGGVNKRRLSARLFFGKIWAKVTSALQGEQKFQIETDNAVAGVRGTRFRVDARDDKSVLVRVYAGAVAVGKNAAGGDKGERREVEGPQEVSRETWEKLVGRQMQIVIAADGSPGEPEKFTAADEKGDDWAKWNESRDEAK